MATTKRFWLKQICNGALVGAFVYVVAGGYGEAIDQRSRQIVIQVDPAKQILNAAGSLTAEDYRQIDCLARNSYFEARSQGAAGMKAVDDVVVNRATDKSGLYPDGLCQVVYQGSIGRDGLPVRDRCQFSWYCDGRAHVVKDQDAWVIANQVAFNEYLYRLDDITGGATRYHATYVSPAWGGWKQTVQIGLHRFFKPKAPQS